MNPGKQRVRLTLYDTGKRPHIEINQGVGQQKTDVDPIRQAIADSWPRSIDDEAARSEWGWQPRYDLAATTTDMLALLTERESRSGDAD